MDIRTLGVDLGLKWSIGALVLVMAGGCPGDDGAAEGGSTGADSGSTSATGGSASSGEGTATGSTGGTGADSGSSTSAGTGETGATETGMEVCQSEPTLEEDAILEVVIDIENDTADSYWVIEFPDFCDEFDVAVGGEVLPRSIAHACGCECPGPPSPMATLVELLPGETHSLRWDGRALAVYQDRFECGPGECFGEPSGRPQPVEPGSVTMTVPLYDAAEFEWPFGQAGVFGEVCPSPLTFDVPVELGTEDVQIDVALSTVVP